MPKADAIVDPKQEDCAYPFKSLCGTGVAYQLMTLLFHRMKRTMSRQEIFLQYTAIATVADVMELVGENRILDVYKRQALGFTKEEMDKPMIGIVSSYNEIVPGHMKIGRAHV